MIANQRVSPKWIRALSKWMRIKNLRVQMMARAQKRLRKDQKRRTEKLGMYSTSFLTFTNVVKNMLIYVQARVHSIGSNIE